MTTYDSVGNQIGALSTPLSGLTGITSGSLAGSVTFVTTTAGVFTYKIQVWDAAGSASNILSGTFTVTSQGGFSQGDITGRWDIVSIRSGGDAGWFRATGDFDALGNATAITNYLDSSGNTTPGPKPLQWTIDSSGVVNQFDNGVNTGFHGKMSSDRKLISWVGTQDNLTHTVQMTIARRRTGTIFRDADLASIPFAYHQLTTGSDNNWEYGAGYTNASRDLNVTSVTLPPGYPGGLPPQNFDTFSVSLPGIVTLANDNTFYGLMTDDKKVIFSIRVDQAVKYVFMVITVTGQTFTQADLAGTFSFASLRNVAPYPTWAYGVTSLDTAGNGSYLSYTDSVGGPTPPAFTRILSPTGVTTDPTDATFHGQLSYNKDISIRTNTSAGRYGLAVSFK